MEDTREKREQISVDPKTLVVLHRENIRCFKPRSTLAKLGAVCAYGGSGWLVGRIARTDIGLRGDCFVCDWGGYVFGSVAALAAVRNSVARRFAR